MKNSKRLDEWYEMSRKCMRCGLCRSVCPVFDVLGTESSVSRGKVQLIRALLEHRLEPTKTLKQMVSLCLNCGACSANCPSGIKVHEMILSARAELLAKLGQPAMERVILRVVAADSGRMALGAKATALYQKTGLHWLAHKTRLLSLLPGDLDTREEFVPNIPLRTARTKLMEVNGPDSARMRVAYFLGCASNLLEPSVAVAVVEVLTHHNCQVVVPSKLECCGMPHRSYGDTQMAAKLEQTNVDILNKANVDAIVVDCATCGSTLKRYEGLRAPVYDVSEFLADVVGLSGDGLHEVGVKVTYHDPCHLVREQSVIAAPRQLIRSVPGIEFVEMAEADRCCGGGGSFNLTHYEVSMAILDRKMRNILDTSATIVASGCPSCRMQINYGIRRERKRRKSEGEAIANGLPVEVLHPVELLARALRDNRAST